MIRVLTGRRESGWVRCGSALVFVVAFFALLGPTGPVPCAVAGAPRGKVAPLSAEYLSWRAQVRDARSSATASRGSALPGLVPSPVDVAGPGGEVISPRAVSYPVSYDLRSVGRVSPVRNQLPFGTCWAFSAVASLESRLLPGETLDFSEDNVALESGFDTEDGAYDQGGNFDMSTAYLTRWAGPVPEGEDPYGDDLSLIHI